MKKIFSLVMLLALCVCPAFAKTVQSVAISPQGAVIQVGTSVTFSALVTYTDLTTDTTCASATVPGFTWSTPTTALSVTTGGSTTSATWNSADDPYNSSLFPNGHQTAAGKVHVVCGGVADTADLQAESVSKPDSFQLYNTPWQGFYEDVQTSALLQPQLVVGATMAVGMGFVANTSDQGNANPIQYAMQWTTNNSSICTVSRYGLVLAVGAGNCIVTGTPGGNGTYTTLTCCGNDYYGNTTGAQGNFGRWEFTVVNPTQNLTTWYVRPNGGTPYVSAGTTPSGQCDGKHDADYPGSGVNQPCAVGNLRYLWTDQVTANHEQWMIGSGDTVIVRQNSSGYMIGLSQRSPAYGGSVTDPINCGNPDCYMPTIPSGTSANHTKILGENYASCSADSSKTKLLVSWASKNGLNVRDSQFVDVACFDISDSAACAYNGSYTNNCTTAMNYGLNGIIASAMTTDDTFTDLYVHGLAQTGWFGASGKNVTLTRVHFLDMPNAGVNMDDSPYNYSNISVAGGINMNYSITEWTGCVEEYPKTHNFPQIECRGQQTGGYGDGLGTASTTGSWLFDHDIWRYNYQDGLDLLHSNMQVLNVTNSQSYGNDGNQYKVGGADTSVLFQNNTMQANCQRISQIMGDQPVNPYQGETLCRAGGGVNVHFSAYGTYLFQNNTFSGYPDVSLGYATEFGSDNASTAITALQNNSFLGMSISTWNGGQSPAVFCMLNVLTNACPTTSSLYPANQGWATRSNNQFYNTRTCPASLLSGETCNTQDPKFASEPSPLALTSETQLDSSPLPYGNSLVGVSMNSPIPTNVSPLLTAGTSYSGSPTVDLNGVASTSPLVVGAMNLAGAATLTTITVLPNPASVTTTTTVNMQTSSFCTYSDSSTVAAGTAPCTVTWTDTGSHSTVNSVTGIVTGVSVGSDTVTATISTIFGTATVNISASTLTVHTQTLGTSTSLGTTSKLQ